MSRGFDFYYYTTAPEDLIPIFEDIAASMPLAIVQKQNPQPKQALSCESTFCMNQSQPLTILADMLEFRILGVCEPGPIGVEPGSWGALKARYRE